MFWDEVKKHYEAGSAHQFLLHFNVDDLLYDEVYGYLPTVPYLMEYLNALGCDFVLGYNTSRGIYRPDIGRWRDRQRMLQLMPPEKKGGEPQPQRPKINERLVFDKPHEDPFIRLDPSPSKELREGLKNLLNQGRTKVGLIIDVLEQLAPNDPALTDVSTDETQRLFNQLQNWASDLGVRRHGHIVLLLTRNTFDIHPNFTVNPEIPVITIPFPDYEERLKFIEYMHDGSEGSSQMRKTLGNNRERETLAGETVGLNLFGIHDVVQQAETAQQKAGGADLFNYRRDSLKTFSHGVLELGEWNRGPPGDDWYVMRVIRDIADGIKNQDLRRVPRGMLCLGPPGTSKAYAARVLAAEANMTLVQLRYASQVGEVTININETGNTYDRNLNAGLNFIRGIAPTVVFMDEIEQASPHTEMNLESQGQTFPPALVNAMNDASLHGKVIWFGASQRPDLMPPIFSTLRYFRHQINHAATCQWRQSRNLKNILSWTNIGQHQFPGTRRQLGNRWLNVAGSAFDRPTCAYHRQTLRARDLHRSRAPTGTRRLYTRLFTRDANLHGVISVARSELSRTGARRSVAGIPRICPRQPN